MTLPTRLLDSSRRSPLIYLAHRANSASQLWIVDKLPDVQRYKLAHGSMRLVSLPPFDENPPDEAEESFQSELAIWRRTDETHLKALETFDRTARIASENERKMGRELRDGQREHLSLAPGRPKADTSLAQHARIHGIEPGYALPPPDRLHEDGRREDHVSRPYRPQRGERRVCGTAGSFTPGVRPALPPAEGPAMKATGT